MTSNAPGKASASSASRKTSGGGSSTSTAAGPGATARAGRARTAAPGQGGTPLKTSARTSARTSPGNAAKTSSRTARQAGGTTKKGPAAKSAARAPRSGPATAALARSRHGSSALIEARDSPIHGRGVYAVAAIRKGTRVLEYLGERISHAEADRRYENKPENDGHTFLFIASTRTVIDAGVHGNDARFINHSCAPNCETVIENSRVFIDAIRNIKPGEELGYDYQLTWESTDEPTELALYACRCGAKKCRGTMLAPEPLDKQDS